MAIALPVIMSLHNHQEHHPPQKRFLRKELNWDALLKSIRIEFGKVPDGRSENQSIELQDALMTGLAVFSLKSPSLLAFDQQRQVNYPSLCRIFGIDQIPCDSSLRTILDPIDPRDLRRAFTKIFAKIQRGKALEHMAYLDGHYLLSGDGTGFFYSTKLKNDSCLVKAGKQNRTTYHQSFYGAALVHPDFKEVIPFAPEFITRKDGQTKNDCEREASKRFLVDFRREHPHLPVIMIEDGLSSNGPHIRELKAHNMRFILGAKENDHTYLFEQAQEAEASGRSTNLTMADLSNPRVRHNLFFVNNLQLNKSHPDIRVNFLEYWEIHLDKDGNEIRKKQKHFSWVTDLEISEENVFQIMRGGRARWKIENETFNTLKNQGYKLEHNYGLGKQNLSRVFVTLTLLAFLVDQTLQLCCALYQAALRACTRKIRLFEEIRSGVLSCFVDFDSMEEILEKIHAAWSRAGKTKTALK